MRKGWRKREINKKGKEEREDDKCEGIIIVKRDHAEP
jgi:hypothetical protein